MRLIRPHIPGLIYTGLVMLVGVAAMHNQNNLLFWVFGVMASGLIISAALALVIMKSLRVRRMDIQHGAVGEPLIVRYAVTNRNRLLSAFNIHVEERSGGGSKDQRSVVSGQRSESKRRRFWILDFGFWIGRIRQSKIQNPKSKIGPASDANWPTFMRRAGAWVMHIGPRETVHGETIFWPARRGEVRFNVIRVSTTFPFGILRKSFTIAQPQHTLIFPKVHELRRGVLRALIPTGLIGVNVSTHPGAGDDYYGMREYRPGDSLRHIAWKRTAMMDQLVCIERTTPSPARVRVILDLATPTNQLKVGGNEPFTAREFEERAINLAASLIHAADLEGFEVGLTVRGCNIAPIAVRKSRWHVNKMMAALAGLDLDAARAAAHAEPIREAERAALVVVAPDRSSPLASRPDAWFLTSRQLETLTSGPIEPSTAARSRESAIDASRARNPRTALPVTRTGAAA